MTQPVDGTDKEPRTDSEILIFGVEDLDTTRSLFRPAKDLRLGRGTVSAHDFADQVSGFIENMKAVLDRLPRFVGEFEIDQIAISAEISAKGKVALLGSGGELGGKGGLTFTFRKTRSGRVDLVAANANDERADEAED